MNNPIPPHGGYRSLHSFRNATIIYDATVRFCHRFLPRNTRTRDQMVQAARSGRQNIAEGSRAAATSAKSELKLTSVGRASLDELLLDYEDFLRQRRLPVWDKQDDRARKVRALARQREAFRYTKWLDHPDPEIAANTVICLIHQTNYLLDRQIKSLEASFLEKGGFSERLYAARMEQRAEGGAKAGSPPCPRCGKPMVKRQARQGRWAGSEFWGCSFFPKCKKTLPVVKE